MYFFRLLGKVGKVTTSIPSHFPFRIGWFLMLKEIMFYETQENSQK